MGKLYRYDEDCQIKPGYEGYILPRDRFDEEDYEKLEEYSYCYGTVGDEWNLFMIVSEADSFPQKYTLIKADDYERVYYD